MNKCKYCGTPLPDGTDFCSVCGAMAQKPESANITKEAPVSAESQRTASVKGAIHGGYLAWSVINIIFAMSFLFLGIPVASLVLSVIALIKTVHAKLRAAKVLNIIATAITIASIILFIAAVIVLFFTGARLFDIHPYYFYEFMD